ncbi:amidohydrolase family protein, partial [bacterium]|nr:amidohydrolase family protein [bacterium]
ALKVLEVLAEGVGAGRIHWGTDWPYLGVQPYPELIRAVREAPFLKPGEAEQVLGLNALKFLE